MTLLNSLYEKASLPINTTLDGISTAGVAVNKALVGLKEGDVSNSFFLMDERKGKESYSLAKLKSKSEPHKANLKYDYQLLKSMLEDEKRTRTFDEWVEEKQSETYISIQGLWEGCEFKYKNWIKE